MNGDALHFPARSSLNAVVISEADIVDVWR
jgi:hypothetical protein